MEIVSDLPDSYTVARRHNFVWNSKIITILGDVNRNNKYYDGPSSKLNQVLNIFEIARVMTILNL